MSSSASRLAALSLSAFCISALPARAQAKPAVIQQLNTSSAKFSSAEADLHQEIFDSRVKNTDVQTGQIYFIRKGGTTQVGMKLGGIGAAPNSPPAQILQLKDGKFQMLTTGSGQVDVYPIVGTNQTKAESLLALGFGGSGTDLEKAWTIDDQGPDTIDSVKTEKLDLVSKDPNIRNNYAHVTIWIDPTRDVTLKQILYMANGGKANGNTRSVTYTDIRFNQTPKTDSFAIKCPGKCSFVQH
jgi:outer membrane lipoprotein-sorting protein